MNMMKFSASALAIVALSATAAAARDNVQVAGSSTVLPYATIVAEKALLRRLVEASQRPQQVARIQPGSQDQPQHHGQHASQAHRRSPEHLLVQPELQDVSIGQAPGEQPRLARPRPRGLARLPGRTGPCKNVRMPADAGRTEALAASLQRGMR